MITKTGSLIAHAPKFLQGAANTLANAGSGLWNIGKNMLGAPRAARASWNFDRGSGLGRWGSTKNVAGDMRNILGSGVNAEQAQALRTVRNYGAAGIGGTMLGKHVVGPMNQQSQQPQQF